jgi:acyl-CoA reductase-like NAD-dependent aldehyde dehydrogenase
MPSAAGTLKRLTLELGGNDAAIVLEDADPKEVAPKIHAAATFISGKNGTKAMSRSAQRSRTSSPVRSRML